MYLVIQIRFYKYLVSFFVIYIHCSKTNICIATFVNLVY
jgi:hypothetical protein